MHGLLDIERKKKGRLFHYMLVIVDSGVCLFGKA